MTHIALSKYAALCHVRAPGTPTVRSIREGPLARIPSEHGDSLRWHERGNSASARWRASGRRSWGPGRAWGLVERILRPSPPPAPPTLRRVRQGGRDLLRCGAEIFSLPASCCQVAPAPAPPPALERGRLRAGNGERGGEGRPTGLLLLLRITYYYI